VKYCLIAHRRQRCQKRQKRQSCTFTLAERVQSAESAESAEKVDRAKFVSFGDSTTHFKFKYELYDSTSTVRTLVEKGTSRTATMALFCFMRLNSHEKKFAEIFAARQIQIQLNTSRSAPVRS